MDKKQLKKLRKFIASYLNMNKDCRRALKAAFKRLPHDPATSSILDIIDHHFLNVEGFITPTLIRNWKIINNINF